MESARSTIKTEITYSDAEKAIETRDDTVAVEEPLQLVLQNGERRMDFAVIMRTPGFDLELAAGFLLSEGIIRKKEDILSVEYDAEGDTGSENIILIRLQEYVEIGSEQRNFYVSSSCGVCGKSSINSVFLKGSAPIRTGKKVSRRLITQLPDRLIEKQAIFRETGGTHAAGLFDFSGNLLLVREDIGRHNAVDKVTGNMLLNGMVGKEEYILQVSGRAGFEIVQKAALAGIPVVSSVSAPTSLAVETARAFNITLLCFARNGRFNIYSNGERIRDA